MRTCGHRQGRRKFTAIVTAVVALMVAVSFAWGAASERASARSERGGAAPSPSSPGYRTCATGSVGVTEPGTTWYLAEGATEGGFETWILVQNPGSDTARVTLTYQTDVGEKPGPTLELAPLSRASVNVADTVQTYDVSTTVRSSVPVVAERAVYWSRPVTVCLDPGHSANFPAGEIDPATGLDVADNEGAPGERQAVWELAVKTKALLEGMGYSVMLTKPSADAYASLRTRADIGNICSIVVRLHYDPDLQAVLYPAEGQYKQRGSSIVYVDPAVSRASAELAGAMLPYLREVGVAKIMNDCGGTSNNTGPAFVGSVLSRVPVVLIENGPDMLRDNPEGQERVAAATARGIDAYMGGLWRAL